MAYKFYNPNPVGRMTNDCSVRALSKALGVTWDEAYLKLSYNGKQMGVMPDNKTVLQSVLRQHGFFKEIVPDTCPDCYTAAAFCFDHPIGIFVLAFSNHVATVVDGVLYDSWDSSQEVPLYYWYKGGNQYD